MIHLSKILKSRTRVIDADKDCTKNSCSSECRKNLLHTLLWMATRHFIALNNSASVSSMHLFVASKIDTHKIFHTHSQLTRIRNRMIFSVVACLTLFRGKSGQFACECIGVRVCLPDANRQYKFTNRWCVRETREEEKVALKVFGHEHAKSCAFASLCRHTEHTRHEQCLQPEHVAIYNVAWTFYDCFCVHSARHLLSEFLWTLSISNWCLNRDDNNHLTFGT